MAALIVRRRRRGAAMVEGVVALLVLVTFFGALLFVFRAQENRLDVQAGAHADALRFASHGCEGDDDVDAAPRFDVGGDTPRTARDVGRGAGGSRTMERSVSSAKAHRERAIEVGQLTSKAASDATVVCNETPIDGSPKGFFEYGLVEFKRYLPKKVEVK